MTRNYLYIALISIVIIIGIYTIDFSDEGRSTSKKDSDLKDTKVKDYPDYRALVHLAEKHNSNPVKLYDVILKLGKPDEISTHAIGELGFIYFYMNGSSLEKGIVLIKGDNVEYIGFSLQKSKWSEKE